MLDFPYWQNTSPPFSPPSHTLPQAYRSTPSALAPRLLADVPIVRGSGPLQTSRKLGPELSRKIHQFFTSLDPDQVLGS